MSTYDHVSISRCVTASRELRCDVRESLCFHFWMWTPRSTIHLEEGTWWWSFSYKFISHPNTIFVPSMEQTLCWRALTNFVNLWDAIKNNIRKGSKSWKNIIIIKDNQECVTILLLQNTRCIFRQIYSLVRPQSLIFESENVCVVWKPHFYWIDKSWHKPYKYWHICDHAVINILWGWLLWDCSNQHRRIYIHVWIKCPCKPVTARVSAHKNWSIYGCVDQTEARGNNLRYYYVFKHF